MFAAFSISCYERPARISWAKNGKQEKGTEREREREVKKEREEDRKKDGENWV